MYEVLPVAASVISSFTRAGLNVVDRKVFRQDRVCPLVVGYWNNFLPILLTLPLIFCTPALNFYLGDLLSVEIVILAVLIQCLSYSFSFAFKALRVTDVAVLSKVADVTVPLVLVLVGFYLISYKFFLLLPAILVIFIFSAGTEVVKKTYRSSIILVSLLTIQGLYIFYMGYKNPLKKEVWSLLSIAFSVLVWRFIFSATLLVFKKKISCIYFFPKEFISHGGFYLRGFLTVLTQITFIFAISKNNLMTVWPILNTTGFLGAVFAYFFLGEKLRLKDYFFIIAVFFITGLAVIFQYYGNYL